MTILSKNITLSDVYTIRFEWHRLRTGESKAGQFGAHSGPSLGYMTEERLGNIIIMVINKNPAQCLGCHLRRHLEG